MNLSAVDLRGNDHHREPSPVICAERAVFVISAAEFRHHDHRDAVALAIQIGVESGEPTRQQVNLFSLQSVCRALKEMRVPSAEVNAGGLKPYAGFDQPRDLAQTCAEIIVGVDCV